MDYLLFFLGFVILIIGADLLVRGASSLGTKFKIPHLIIGLTIVALGTSLPELVINIFASGQDNTELAISNVLGSNIMNILLIIGLAAIIFPIKVSNHTTFKDIPVSLFAVVLLGFLVSDNLVFGKEFNYLSKPDGWILLVFFAGYMTYTYYYARNNPGDIQPGQKKASVLKSILFILSGIAGLFFGGEWIVNSSYTIGELLGLDQTAIGVTIVATATSIPELVTSIVAAIRKDTDIAIGNAVGSCIFNVLLVLGLSSVISPLPFLEVNMVALWIVILSGLLLFILVFTGRGRKISRVEGVIMVLAYIVFIVYSLTCN